MKTPPCVLAALLVITSAINAAPRLVLSTPALVPESQISVVFDAPIATTAEMGKSPADAWVDIQPALEGKWVAQAPEILRFFPSQPPSIATTYEFSIPEKRAYLDRSAVPAGKFATVTSEAFRVVAASSPRRWSRDYTPATSEWLVVLNDAVDPATVANYISFSSGDLSAENPRGGLRVRARVERATVKRAGYYGTAYQPWAARFPSSPAPENEKPAPEAALTHVLLISPESPLPVADKWSVTLLKGMPNAAASARTTEDLTYEIGKVEPFLATRAYPVVEADQPRKLRIEFNQPLAAALPVDFLAKCVDIRPRPAGLSAVIDGREIELSGDFTSADEYLVNFRKPFVSQGGVDLGAPLTATVKFERLEPELILPSENQAQLANGSRTYSIRTVNLSALHVRVKRLTGVNLVRAYQGYRNYTGMGPDGSSIEPTAPLPYGLVVGETVWEKEIALDNPVDTSKEITIRWDDIQIGESRHAALFLDITGTPNPASGKSGRRNAQALLQLTDIGLAWKLTTDEAMVYAFSCHTGAPLPGVRLDFLGEDAATLRTATTDASGLATLSRAGDLRHLHASLGDDSFLTAFDSTLDTVGLWHFPVRYEYKKAAPSAREAVLFTDRSLYRPGETVRLKGIVRNRRGNAVELPAPGAARIVVLDPTEKEIHTSPVTVSENGSFDLSYSLPSDKTGTHTIRLEYPEELAAAAALQDDWEKREAILAGAHFEIPLRVEDFRRNAFEIQQAIAPPTNGATAVTTALSANYYQGQPVAAGMVKYFSRVSPSNPYPERFRDFLFGNHRKDDWAYWYHYFGYRESDGADFNSQRTQAQGETQLAADGQATFVTEIPKSDFPTTREVTISSEVMDANHQTLTSTTTATVHPASIYIGVSRVDRLIRVGDTVALRLVATDTAGEPFTAAVQVTATLTREINNVVKNRTDAGEVTTRNEVSEEAVATYDLTLDPAASAGAGTALDLAPQATGKHYLTLRGVDPGGRPFATVMHFNAYGTTEYPWLYEDGLRVKLVAEKKSYLPGDTARILVLSPIEGTALVTVEREKILRSFQVPLHADRPVIEVPLSADDAPNAFVSVLIIKGAKESAREHREPQLRLGYCELIVENKRDELALTVQALGGTDGMSFRPGDSVMIAGTARSADGSPAAGAEVTLYAEDEGTLAVTGYENPEPMTYFYRPRSLAVDTGTSFSSFISENPENRYFSNKGFFIGGGGDAARLAALLRKNFDPCATWAPALVTDATGAFTHTFTLPDTLTRYRIIAVAHHGAARFGTAESAVVAKKDLMLEPKTPRFANQSDAFNTQVLVQNASPFAGTWEIQFSSGTGAGTPCVTPTGPVSETVSLAAGASATLVFPARAADTGEAVLTWTATPISLDGAELTSAMVHRLSDRVETRFPIQYPVPIIRASKRINLGTERVNLRDAFPAELMDGSGEITLDFSRSPLVEAAGSADFLLHYPYGCVEQTTSSLMPWLSVESLKPVVPKFAAMENKKVSAAIQAGVDRLLSMQLPDGSFSYWPGSHDSVPWATSYAALGLLMAAENGANVPDSATARFTKNLQESLRGMANERSPSALELHARSLLVLAKGGAPQPAYRNLMVDRVAELTPAARSLLACAIASEEPGNSANLTIAKTVLTSPIPFRGTSDSWMRWSADDAFNLLAWLAVDPNGPEPARALDRMFRERNPYGEWRTTWVNGWSLMAMAAYAKHENLSPEPITLTLESEAGSEKITLDQENPTTTRNFRLSRQLQLATTSDRGGIVRAAVRSKPRIAPFPPISNNGISVDRFYERLNPDGTAAVLTEPKIGDLIRVSLQVTLPRDGSRYLVVEDALPAIFETVNNDFKTQAAAVGNQPRPDNWHVSHTELRTDRASFFVDMVSRHGTYTVSYLARCTVDGQATAPPAKVEMMYEPENFGLSASRVFTSK